MDQAKRLETLVGHDGGVTTAAFSADGRYLASSSFDTTVRLWDWQRGIEVYCVKLPRAALFIAPMSATHFGAVLWNGRVIQLPIDPLAEATLRKPRDLTPDEIAEIERR